MTLDTRHDRWDTSPDDLAEISHSQRRILILDDHQAILAGLKAAVGSTFHVETALSMGSVKYALERDRFDLVVVDFFLGPKDTTSLIQWIRSTYPETNLVVMTGYITADLLLRLNGLNITGILDKKDPIDFITRSIELAVVGNRVYSNSVAASAIDALQQQSTAQGAAPDKAFVLERLGTIERDILTLVGQGKTTTAIAHELGLTTRSVEHYRRRLRDVLHASSNSQLVLAAFNLGLAPK